ncbi:MAG: hypothetical protein AAF149_03320 [Bacteroidota bacterium]
MKKISVLFVLLILCTQISGNVAAFDNFIVEEDQNNKIFKVTASVLTASLSKFVEVSCLTVIKNPYVCAAVKKATEELVNGTLTYGVVEGIKWSIEKGNLSKINIFVPSKIEAIIAASVFREQKSLHVENSDCGVDWESIDIPPECMKQAFQIEAIGTSYRSALLSEDILFPDAISNERMRDIKSSLDVSYHEQILMFIDGTALLSTKSVGIAFTSKGIYWRNGSFSSNNFMSWANLEDRKINSEEGSVIIHKWCENWIGQSVSCNEIIGSAYSDLEAYEISGLINDIRNIFTSANKQ